MKSSEREKERERERETFLYHNHSLVHILHQSIQLVNVPVLQKHFTLPNLKVSELGNIDNLLAAANRKKFNNIIHNIKLTDSLTPIGHIGMDMYLAMETVICGSAVIVLYLR